MDKELEADVREQIASDINKMISSKLRQGKPYPMVTQVELAELLYEGKRACQFASIPFNKWVKQFVNDLSHEECKRLAMAGESGSPEKHILMRREKNRKVNITWRKRNRGDIITSRYVKKKFDTLPKPLKVKFLKDICEDFPPFPDYDEEAAEIINDLERRIDNE